MYEFTEDCMIHVEEIDNEHRRLFQMINEAVALVDSTDDAQVIASNTGPLVLLGMIAWSLWHI